MKRPKKTKNTKKSKEKEKRKEKSKKSKKHLKGKEPAIKPYNPIPPRTAAPQMFSWAAAQAAAQNVLAAQMAAQQATTNAAVQAFLQQLSANNVNIELFLQNLNLSSGVPSVSNFNANEAMYDQYNGSFVGSPSNENDATQSQTHYDLQHLFAQYANSNGSNQLLMNNANNNKLDLHEFSASPTNIESTLFPGDNTIPIQSLMTADEIFTAFPLPTPSPPPINDMHGGMSPTNQSSHQFTHNNNNNNNNVNFQSMLGLDMNQTSNNNASTNSLLSQLLISNMPQVSPRNQLSVLPTLPTLPALTALTTLSQDFGNIASPPPIMQSSHTPTASNPSLIQRVNSGLQPIANVTPRDINNDQRINVNNVNLLQQTNQHYSPITNNNNNNNSNTNNINNNNNSLTNSLPGLLSFQNEQSLIGTLSQQPTTMTSQHILTLPPSPPPLPPQSQ